MNTKGKGDDLRILKEFKDKYELTWPEVAEALGRSLSAVENWYTNKKIPLLYKKLLQIFIKYPNVYNEFNFRK